MCSEKNVTKGRAFCSSCDFLKSRCLCSTLKLLDNKLHLVVLQHHSENKHPLNTVRIMQKSLNKITVLSGENFSSHEELNTLLSHHENRCVLLFPNKEALLIEQKSNKKISHLILIDGTWRKAKKIFTSSTNLHSLECIRLSPEKESNYRIRKTPGKEAMSSLEAVVQAFSILEPALETASMTLSFEKMIDLQIKKMGQEIYQNNYLNKKNFPNF